MKNLWGELPAAEPLRLPVVVFKEQGAALSEITNGVLRCDVDTSRSKDQFLIQMSIIAPALDNYSYLAAIARHKVHGYPATLIAGWNWILEKDVIECANPDQFETALSGILSSRKMHSVIQALLTQSRA